ncbi:MAG TPA: pitrilysin family protein [Polyangiaceae bacterium]|nr:pitrilysin family protein [Polyangiaceae bacterium]
MKPRGPFARLAPAARGPFARAALAALALGACAPEGPARPARPAPVPPPPVAAPAAPDPLGPKPEATEPAPFTPPTPLAFGGPSGSKVWLLERHALPLVSVALALPYGASSDPPDAGGLAHLVADMVDEGAGARDAVAFSSALEELGARLSARASRDYSVVVLETTADNLDKALALFGDAVLRPRHAPKDFARVTALWKNALRARGDDPSEVARVVTPAAFFGPSHPYGRPVEGSLGGPAIARERVAAWHRRLFRPEAATFVVAGDVTRERAASALAAAFKGWATPRDPAPAPAPPAPPAAPPPAGRRTVAVEREGAPQVVISLVRRGVAAADPARPALELLNVPLGGTFTSRLNQNLREDHGWTYGARTGFDAQRADGTFLVRTSVRTDALAEALRETLKELDQMAQKGPSDAEVAGAKALARADAIRSYGSLGSIALGLAANAGLGLPPDADAAFLAAQMAEGRARLAELGRRHVDTGDLTLVFVGPRRPIEDALAANQLPPPERWTNEGRPLDGAKAPDKPAAKPADKPTPPAGR